jgi:hypothetical protein
MEICEKKQLWPVFGFCLEISWSHWEKEIHAGHECNGVSGAIAPFTLNLGVKWR